MRVTLVFRAGSSAFPQSSYHWTCDVWSRTGDINAVAKQTEFMIGQIATLPGVTPEYSPINARENQ